MHIQNLFSDELPDIVGPGNPFAKKRKIQESTESSYDPSASLFSDGNETSFVFRIDQNPQKEPEQLTLLLLLVIQMKTLPQEHM